MKNKIWIVLLAMVFVICGIMYIVDGSASWEETDFVEVNESEREIDDGIDFREVYTRYGKIAVNWYYAERFPNGEEKYEVIIGSGLHCWLTKQQIAEIVIQYGD